MLVKILSSKGYEDTSKNYGDCIIIDNDEELVIYDCGSVEHAERVIEYMEKRNIEKAKVILSHNDRDHFEGIPFLVENDKVSVVYTVLLLKNKDELLKVIGDGRRNRDSIAKQILDIYDNIASLGNQGLLENAKENKVIAKGITIVGPSHEYIINACAKHLDKREGDSIDQETIVNATSVQVAINIGSDKLLLCGDSSFKAIEDKLVGYKYIQLPHHGKIKQAQKIFDLVGNDNGIQYIVSDNTGSSNGGSDNLPSRGYDILNSKTGDKEIINGSARAKVVGYYSKGEK